MNAPGIPVTQAIGETEFCSLVHCRHIDLPPRCRHMLHEKKLRYRRLLPAERDGHILRVLQTVEELKARHRQENYSIFENGWEENYARCVAQGVSWQALVPSYIKFFPYVRYRGDFIAPEGASFVDELFAVVLAYAFEKYLGDAQRIYEFGCGTGRYLLMLSEMYPETALTGLDWTEASMKIIELMQQKGIHIQGRRFDMLNPDPAMRLEPGSAVVTISSLEQMGGDFTAFLSYLLAQRPALVLHHEPVEEFYDTADLFDYLARTYHRRRGYLSGYWTTLNALADDGVIEILEARRNNFGDPYMDGASLIAWRPKE